jgi:hypothetical protein
LATASCIDTSTTCPRPVRCRSMYAAMMPATMCTPAPLSPMLAPHSTGSRSGKPVTLITPPVAWAIMSKLLYS